MSKKRWIMLKEQKERRFEPGDCVRLNSTGELALVHDITVDEDYIEVITATGGRLWDPTGAFSLVAKRHPK